MCIRDRGVAMALKNPMYHFLSAYTLKEAIEYWKDNQIDMVILEMCIRDRYDVIEKTVPPKTIDINRQAFDVGYQL